jgi:hypothetical protein
MANQKAQPCWPAHAACCARRRTSMNCALRGGEEKDMLDMGAAVGWVAAAMVVGYIIYVAMYGHHHRTGYGGKVRFAGGGATPSLQGTRRISGRLRGPALLPNTSSYALSELRQIPLHLVADPQGTKKE